MLCQCKEHKKGKPIGYGHWICEHNNLKYLYPELCKEWDNEKNPKDPSDYLPGSNVTVWWKCLNNSHCPSWEDKIINRTHNKHGCPICTKVNINHTGYSKIQIQWIKEIMKRDKINIIHAENGSEYKIPNVGYVDGYCAETNTVYEFHGDFYHGHPSKYPSDKIHPLLNKKYGELYEQTLKRDALIISLGYNLVSIWEHQYLAWSSK